MTFKILYYALGGNHITLKEDGSIEIWTKKEQEPLIIDYLQARVLKRMVIAEHELDRIGK